MPFDCTAGYANWMAEWSVGKKMWCCQNTGKGCPLRQVGVRQHGAVALRLHGGLCQLEGGVARACSHANLAMRVSKVCHS